MLLPGLDPLEVENILPRQFFGRCLIELRGSKCFMGRLMGPSILILLCVGYLHLKPEAFHQYARSRVQFDLCFECAMSP